MAGSVAVFSRKRSRESNNNAALHHIENKFNKVLEPLKVK
jgi:hypothetical protein